MKHLTDVPAPAKLNLFLHVVGRRPDGYHLLESVFALIDWMDTLHFELRSDERIARHDLGVSLPEDDLCLRAARLLRQAAGMRGLRVPGVDISIDKRIPSGAGLGGGSSDAATVLIALNRLWGLQWGRSELQELAAQLGADVPFFVFGRNAWVSGIGEELRSVAIEQHTYAVIKPSAFIPTSEIFSSPDLRRDSPSAIMEGSLDSAVLTDLIANCGRNDLQPVAESLFPEVAQAALRLHERFGNSRMTGSGSAVFSRVDIDDLSAATWPQQEPPPQAWTARLCHGLVQHPLLHWLD